MSVLFCDSNCELWFDEVERLGLKFISMPYTLEDTEYFYDLGKNTDFDFWYKSVRNGAKCITCLLYTSPSPRDMRRSRMPSSA